MQNPEYLSGLWRWASAAVFALGCLWDPNCGLAADVVEIESKWVDAGAENVTLGITFENATSLSAVLVPLEIRSIHVGSFIRRSLDIRPGGRLQEFGGNEPPVITKLFFPYKSPTFHGVQCPTDSLGNVWRWMAHDSLPDFMGEEALLYFFAGVDMERPNMPPGRDADNDPSLVLQFDVTDQGGAFVIDTACISLANHLVYVEEGERAISPEFRVGIVLIGCNAECHGDPICDGECNIIDLVRSVDVAFNGAPPAIDPDPRCPVENTDVNCDMVTNVLDIVRMINVQYRSLSQASQFCVPCDHIPRTGNPRDDVKTPYFRNNGTY